MSVDIDVVQMHDTISGKCVAVNATARVTYSPREGFNAEKLASFEKELTDLCKRRLEDALEGGAA